MENLFLLLKEVNIAQIIILLFSLWFFYNRLDKKIDDKTDKIESRIDKLESKIEDIDRRLCRIEGSLSTQGHCLYSQKNIPERKAE